MAGAPVGNTNATKGKPWIAAINRALAQGDANRLRNIAEKLINKAEEGDMMALKEIGDRLDGKSIQGISGPDGEPLVINIISADAGSA